MLTVRIDQSGKFSALTLLRAMDPKYSQNSDLLRVFFETNDEKVVDGRSVSKLEGKIAVGDVVYPANSDKAGEIIVESGQKITKNAAELICTSGLNHGRSDGRLEGRAAVQYAPGRQHGQP